MPTAGRSRQLAGLDGNPPNIWTRQPSNREDLGEGELRKVHSISRSSTWGSVRMAATPAAAAATLEGPLWLLHSMKLRLFV